jgi:uncharacterized protein (DUF433 family)
MLTTGVYSADRAAALSGVPKSTIHYWARTGVLLPSVSPERVRLWSFADLMGLRIISWLRREKTTTEGVEIPSSTMLAVRRALASLEGLELSVWTPGEGSPVVVSGKGDVYIDRPGGLVHASGQIADRDLLQPIAPFFLGGMRGPDLVRPRPTLRIIPGKLGGSPHVEDTRVETRALAALREDGMSVERIEALYPHLTAVQIREAIDLEEQLKRNLLLPEAA